jgi:hypothetical protein
MSAMHHQPSGAAFDVVLLLHVGCAVAGLATTAAAAATATRLRRLLRGGAPVPDALRRYFQPGVNWAGRAVYGIPVFGVALVAMSQGTYALGDGWIVAGVVLFVTMAAVGEGVLWPAERRLQTAVTAMGSGTDGVPEPIAATASGAVIGNATAVARSAEVALVLLLAGMVVMVAQP